MVEIKLDRKQGDDNYTGKYEVKISKEDHKEGFEKVTYSIKYGYEFPWFPWYKWPFHIYIINKTNYNFYTYYAQFDDHVVNKVEVFYSKRHEETPLIIGFERSDHSDFKYFTQIYLKNEGYSTGYPPRGDFGPNELDERLKQENELRNKITFVEQLKQSKNYREITENTLTNYTRYRYFVKNDETYGTYQVSPDLLFSHENQNNIDVSLLSKLDSQKFDFINAYYSNSGSKALLIEFDDENKKTYYQRNDFDGTFWVETTISEEDGMETTLQKIEEESKKRLSYHIDKKSNDNHSYKKEKIIVTSNNRNPGLRSYVHTRSSQHKDKTQFFLFNKSLIKVLNVDGISGKILEDINKKVYFTVTVYFKLIAEGKEVDSEPPFLMELSANGNDTEYYLTRVDREGVTWKQIEKNAADINDQEKKTKLLEQVHYYSKKSIVIPLNKNQSNSDYPVNLLENNPDIDILASQAFQSTKIKFKLSGTLPTSKYKWFTHDLSNVKTQSVENSFVDVSWLRLFITGNSDHSIDLNNPIEINLYNSNESKQEYLYYNPSEISPSGTNCPNDSTASQLYVYFYHKDTIPLLLYYRCKWYRSRSKDKYFQEWVEETSLQSIRPDSEDKNGIKNKLDEINKEFNQIDISNTKGNYGLCLPSNKEAPKGIDPCRVKVETQSIDLYIKINHTTVNNSSIGKLMYGDEEVKDNQNDQPVPSSSSMYNRVSVYYHETNKDHNFPLLIGIGNENKTDAFYERSSKDQKIRWNRVATTSSLQHDGEELAYKINSIHYNFNKSVIIQLEKQDKRDYKIFLVDNKDLQGFKLPVIGSTISVSKQSNCSTDSYYTCFKHTINLNGSINHNEIGGFRIYIYSIEIMTCTSDASKYLINYSRNKNEVLVYFYGNSKVPLLVFYNDKFYGPKSRDEYFKNWVIYGNNSGFVSQLKDQLNKINKLLNQIDLYHLKNNVKYGIPKPEQQESGLPEDFLSTITVKNCKNNHYRKVTHSTINKFSIGQVMHNAKPLSFVDVSSLSPNHISVYYQLDDRYYSIPLLIKLWSDSSPDVSNWYYRTKLEPTEWKNDQVSSYDTDAQLQHRLVSIAKDLFILAVISMEQNGTSYHITTMKPGDATVKLRGETFFDTIQDTTTIKVESYRRYGHGLVSFYENNKDTIRSKFSISDESDLTFELSLEIFGKKILLFDKQDTLISLYYTKEDYGRNRDIHVYFYEQESYNSSTDVVPLILMYKDKYYTPESKETYFMRWKELDLFLDTKICATVVIPVDNRETEKLKEKFKCVLDNINAMLNQIDPSKKADYGIPYCKLREKPLAFYNDGKSSSKRIQVTRHTNKYYIMRVHDPVNKHQITNIKPISKCNFTEVQKNFKNERIDQVVVIFKIGDINVPKLILLNKKDRFVSEYLTHGFYYQLNPGPLPLKFEFHYEQVGLNLMDSFKNGRNDFDEGNSLSREIKEILIDVTKEKMIRNTTDLSELDKVECKSQVDSEFDVQQCRETLTTKPIATIKPSVDVGPDIRLGVHSGSNVHRHPASSVSVTAAPQRLPPKPEQHPSLSYEPSINPPGQILPKTPGEGPPHSSQRDHQSDQLELDPKTRAVSPPGDLDQKPESPGLEQASGSPPQVLVHSNPEAGFDASKNTVESPGLHTTVHSKERQTPPGGAKNTEHLPDNAIPSENESVKDQRSRDGSDSGKVLGTSGNSDLNQEGKPSETTTGDVPVVEPGSSNGIPGTGGENQIHKYVKTGLEGFDNFMNKAIDYTIKHPEVVGGAGGGVVTVAGSSYPLYKLIVRFKK